MHQSLRRLMKDSIRIILTEWFTLCSVRSTAYRLTTESVTLSHCPQAYSVTLTILGRTHQTIKLSSYYPKEKTRDFLSFPLFQSWSSIPYIRYQTKFMMKNAISKHFSLDIIKKQLKTNYIITLQNELSKSYHNILWQQLFTPHD